MTKVGKPPLKTDGYYTENELLRTLASGLNPDGTSFALTVDAPIGGVQATDAAGKALAAQRFYFAGSGKITLAAAGNLRAAVQNPAASGRTLYLARIVVFATAAGWANLFVNPTAGVPTSAIRPVNNAVLGAATGPVGATRIDMDLTTALSGGTDTGVVLGIEANRRQVIDLPPFVLAAGTTLGINVPFTGSADATLTVYWWEEL